MGLTIKKRNIFSFDNPIEYFHKKFEKDISMICLKIHEKNIKLYLSFVYDWLI